MLDATWSLVGVGVAQTVVLLFTLWFVRGTMRASNTTLDLTRQALVEAERATAAARETVVVATETARAAARAAQENLLADRAHLAVEYDTSVTRETTDLDAIHTVSARIINYGRTPARSVRAVCTLFSGRTEPMTLEVEFFAIGPGPEHSRTVPLPNCFEDDMTGLVWEPDGRPCHYTLHVEYATVFDPGLRDGLVVATTAFVPRSWTFSVDSVGYDWEQYDGEYRDAPKRYDFEIESASA